MGGRRFCRGTRFILRADADAVKKFEGVKRPAKGEKAKSPKSLIYWAFRGFLPKGANSEK